MCALPVAKKVTTVAARVALKDGMVVFVGSFSFEAGWDGIIWDVGFLVDAESVCCGWDEWCRK